MTARVARLALPFTDDDISAATADIRCYNTATTTTFTVTVALPSVSGVSNGYYNGGDLGTADTSTYTLPGESLVMAVVEAIAAHGSGFDITVAEDPLLPGRYVLTRKDANQWEIRWGDVLTTFEPQWLGFDAVTYTSTPRQDMVRGRFDASVVRHQGRMATEVFGYRWTSGLRLRRYDNQSRRGWSRPRAGHGQR
jgi:hypothetical protein